MREYLMRRPSLLVAVLFLFAVIVIVFGVLAETHVSTDAYLSLVSPIIVTLLGLFVVSRQIDDVRDKQADIGDRVANVETNTNGKLDKRFVALHSELEIVKNRLPETDTEPDNPSETAHA